MTELAAFVMALMLTVELGLAIAFGAAWLAARQPGQSGPRASSKTPTTGGVAGVCRQIRHGRPIRTLALHFSQLGQVVALGLGLGLIGEQPNGRAIEADDHRPFGGVGLRFSGHGRLHGRLAVQLARLAWGCTAFCSRRRSSDGTPSRATARKQDVWSR